MIDAFIIAIFAVFLAYQSSKEKKHSYCLLMAFILLTLFLSLGYYWGNDVTTYEEWYQSFVSSEVSWWDFSNYDSFTQHDYGFILINLLCKPFGFWGMRAIIFVFENAIIYNFVKKHVDKKYYWLAIFIYVFNPNFWVLGSSMMRQWLAMCIVLYGTEFLLKKRYVAFTLFVFIASSIHSSALICLSFIPLFNVQKKPTTTKVVFFISLIVLYWIFSPIFIGYVEFFLKAEELYLGYTETQGSFGITSVGRLLLYTVLLFYAVKTKQRDSFFNWIVMLYSLILPLLSLGELSSRLGYYFSLFTLGVYPLHMNNTQLPQKTRYIVIAIVCAYLIYSFIIFFQSPTYSRYFGTYHTIIGRV